MLENKSKKSSFAIKTTKITFFWPNYVQLCLHDAKDRTLLGSGSSD